MILPYMFSRKTDVEYVSDIESFSFDMLDSVTEALKKERSIFVELQDWTIKFRGPIARFVWNGLNFLNPISYGEVEIKKVNSTHFLLYKLYFWESFVLALFFSIPFAMLIRTHSDWGILGLCGVWFIYLITCGVAIFRFNKFMKTHLEKVNNKDLYLLQTEIKNEFKLF